MRIMTPEQYAAHQAHVKSSRTVKFEANQTDAEIRKAAKCKAAQKRVRVRPKYNYEQQLALQLTMLGFRDFDVDVRYLPDRMHRADILFRKERLVVEIQGQVHRIRDKWARDIEKAQLTFLAGWRLLPIATKQVRDGTAVEIVRRAIDLVPAGVLSTIESF